MSIKKDLRVLKNISREYPWDKKPEEVEAPEVPEEVQFKRMVRSERKRIKKLKHAGVRDYLEERYQ